MVNNNELDFLLNGGVYSNIISEYIKWKQDNAMFDIEETQEEYSIFIKSLMKKYKVEIRK